MVMPIITLQQNYDDTTGYFSTRLARLGTLTFDVGNILPCIEINIDCDLLSIGGDGKTGDDGAG